MKSNWLWIAIFLSASAIADEKYDLEKKYDQDDVGTPVVSLLANEPRVGGRNLSFQKLQDIISKNNVKTIEELIPLLPEDYRRYYTLMYSSGSEQGATFEKPRVIMFGPDSRFILAFAGSAEMEGGNSIETIEWDEDGADFKFRKIVFDQEKKLAKPNAITDSSKCVGCHREDLRPNWDTYPLWAGAYGSHETTLAGTIEDQKYKEFLKNKASIPRYASLINPKTRGSAYTKSYDLVVDSSKIPLNGMLGNYLQALNMKRVLNRSLKLNAGKEYSRFKYALAATALECTTNFDFGKTAKNNVTTYSVEELVPAGIKFPRAIKPAPVNYKTALNEVWNAQYAHFNNIVPDVAKVNEGEKAKQPKNPNENGIDQHHLTATYYYILSRMGLNIDDFSMTFANKTFSFGTFGSGIKTLSDSLLGYIAASKDADLSFVSFSNPPKTGSKEHVTLCERLKELSQKALGAYSKKKENEEKPANPKVTESMDNREIPNTPLVPVEKTPLDSTTQEKR